MYLESRTSWLLDINKFSPKASFSSITLSYYTTSTRPKIIHILHTFFVQYTPLSNYFVN